MAYEFDGMIRYTETDLSRRLTMISLVNYFQDCSSFQSESIGRGVDYLREKNRAWMILSWQIDILRRPKMGEKVTAQTWPYSFRGFYGYRNFTLMGENGEYFAKANSTWVHMDTKTGKPVRVQPEDVAGYEISEKLPMEEFPRKIHVPEGGARMEAFPVGRHHLDTNHHVNNCQYIGMAEEYLPEGFETGRLRVEYRQQARLHDVILPIVHKEEDEVIVSLCSEEEKPYAVVAFARKKHTCE